MSKRDFLRINRSYISDAIAAAYGENCRPKSDKERWHWVMNDEWLYTFARRNGVNV